MKYTHGENGVYAPTWSLMTPVEVANTLNGKDEMIAELRKALDERDARIRKLQAAPKPAAIAFLRPITRQDVEAKLNYLKDRPAVSPLKNHEDLLDWLRTVLPGGEG